jgi:hypothetical protein
MVILNVSIDFLDDSMDKLLGIWLIQGLLEVHDVTLHEKRLDGAFVPGVLDVGRGKGPPEFPR